LKLYVRKNDDSQGLPVDQMLELTGGKGKEAL
jgi:hypothetical protein